MSLPITCLTSIGASSGGASSGSRSNRKFFDLPVYLVRNRERVVSKDDLLQAIWGGRIVSESTMTSRINAARKAVGDNGERVTEPEQIVPAIRRGIEKTREGTPALLEFITEKAVDVSRFS